APGDIRGFLAEVIGPGTPSADAARLHGCRILVDVSTSACPVMHPAARIVEDGIAAPPAAAPSHIVTCGPPALRADVIEQVIRRWRAPGAAAVRPRYEEAPDEPGHPVLVSKGLWADVRQLEGDAGLGQVLARLPVAYVDVPGANPDIDTPRDL